MTIQVGRDIRFNGSMRGNIIAILARGDTTATQYQISYVDPEFGDGRKKHHTMKRSHFVRFNIDLIWKFQVKFESITIIN